MLEYQLQPRTKRPQQPQLGRKRSNQRNNTLWKSNRPKINSLSATLKISIFSKSNKLTKKRKSRKLPISTFPKEYDIQLSAGSSEQNDVRTDGENLVISERLARYQCWTVDAAVEKRDEVAKIMSGEDIVLQKLVLWLREWLSPLIILNILFFIYLRFDIGMKMRS